MISLLLMALFVLALGLISGYEATKGVRESAIVRNFLGKDMQKWGKPLVPEFGGLGYVLGFIVSVVIIWLLVQGSRLYEYYDFARIAMLVSSVVGIGGLLGLMSDIFKFKWRTNFLIPIIASAPLLWMAMDPRWSYIYVPYLGRIQLGVLYGFALMIGATGTANAVNMIAGYNGLEAGMTSVILATLGVMLLMNGNLPLAMVVLLMLSAIAGFFIWNKYPAKIFPGDVGTWSFGASIFAVAVLGKLEFWAVLLFPLYFVHLYLFLRHKRDVVKHREKFTKVNKSGVLSAKTDGAIYFWLARRFRMTEKKMVLTLVGSQIVVSLVVLMLFMLAR